MSFHVAGGPGLPIVMAAIILIVEIHATAPIVDDEVRCRSWAPVLSDECEPVSVSPTPPWGAIRQMRTRLRVFETAHIPVVDDPVRVTALIDDFLQRHVEFSKERRT